MLSIVSTPIGNLKDITIRAMDVLRSCSVIACEDTRVTGQLLHLLELPKKELVSIHSYSDPARVDALIARLKKGEHVCLVSDAGTPCISDPGYLLVSKARDAKLPVEVIPGASAFMAALSASGLPINRFRYFGFLPLKKGRKSLLASLASEEDTVVFYESPHRMEKTLSELQQALGSQPQRRVAVCRELTKFHEQVLVFTIAEAEEAKQKLIMKGEFVLVLEGNRQ